MVKMFKAMKKILFFAAVAAIAASCVNENYETEKYVINASIEQTKTALDGVKTNWTAGDELSVFNADKSNCKFTTAITEASASATFTYTGAFQPCAQTCAFYPYSQAIATQDFATFTGLEIPEIQTPVENGFDPTATLCFARVQSENVTFQNLTALIKFTVAADEVYNVKVVATGANLAGTSTFDGTTLVASEAAAQLKGRMLNGKTFYLAVAPGTFNTLTVFVNGIEVTAKGRQNKTLVAGKIYDLGELANPRPSIVADGYNVSDIATADFFTKEDHADVDAPRWTDLPFSAAQSRGGSIYRVLEDGTPVDVDGKTITEKLDLANWQATKKSQVYSVIYGYWALNAYFSVDWEGSYNGDATKYPIIDTQDRNGDINSPLLNNSYYDSQTNSLVFNYTGLENEYVHAEGKQIWTIKHWHGVYTK